MGLHNPYVTTFYVYILPASIYAIQNDGVVESNNGGTFSTRYSTIASGPRSTCKPCGIACVLIPVKEIRNRHSNRWKYSEYTYQVALALRFPESSVPPLVTTSMPRTGTR